MDSLADVAMHPGSAACRKDDLESPLLSQCWSLWVIINHTSLSWKFWTTWNYTWEFGGDENIDFLTGKAESGDSLDLKLKWFTRYLPLHLDSGAHLRVVLGLHSRHLASCLGNYGQERDHTWEGCLHIRETWTNGYRVLAILKIMP